MAETRRVTIVADRVVQELLFSVILAVAIPGLQLFGVETVAAAEITVILQALEPEAIPMAGTTELQDVYERRIVELAEVIPIVEITPMAGAITVAQE